MPVLWAGDCISYGTRIRIKRRSNNGCISNVRFGCNYHQCHREPNRGISLSQSLLYAAKQNSYFFVRYGFLFRLVINCKECDFRICFIDNHIKCNDPYSAALAFTFTLDCHSDFPYSITEVCSHCRIFDKIFTELGKIRQMVWNRYMKLSKKFNISKVNFPD